ncbi:hypothetical protein [Actinoplanes subtropicus]|uniref:hypothetical protein n=1 Tax=Actinoplanes subtropicus TaxID=543632 RepID=UPI0004C3FA40|nr:hypothetical protein [Actinoplanes subtropicus]
MSDDETVIAPGGPRPRSSTHLVPPGSVVVAGADGSLSVRDAAEVEREKGRAMADTESGPQRQQEQQGGPDDLVLTPGGLRRRSQVHEVPPGHRLRLREQRMETLAPDGRVVTDHGVMPVRPFGRPLMPFQVRRPEREAETAIPALGSGWITYASWLNDTGTPVSRFTTTWTVPPAPATSNGQTIFLFNGIQNSTMIYQPVLQWGPSAAGGGAKWSVASWYADGQTGQSFHSTLVDVDEGDVLTGVMTLTGQGPAGFSYDCEFTGIATAGLPIQDVEELTWCIETLEAYGVTVASDYPNSSYTAMRGIGIDTGTTHPSFTWTGHNDVTDTGQHTLVENEDVSADAGEVDIWYRPSPYWVSGFGSIAPGTSQDWWFSWGGTGDVGPQLIQAQPVEPSGELVTVQVSETSDTNGHLGYHATVRNDGPSAVRFQWRGGGR